MNKDLRDKKNICDNCKASNWEEIAENEYATNDGFISQHIYKCLTCGYLDIWNSLPWPK